MLVQGQWYGMISLEAGEEEVRGWRVDLEFSSTVEWIESVMGEVRGAGAQWTLQSREWDQDIPGGGTYSIHLVLQS